MYNTRPEELTALLDLVYEKSEQILKNDLYTEAQRAVAKGKNMGLIRKKTQAEIDAEMRKKPWLEVNRISAENIKKKQNK